MEYRIMNIRDIPEAQLRLWFSQSDPQRKESLLRLRRKEDQLRSLCADHLARELLSERLNRAPTDLVFPRTEKGKPYLDGSPLHFNLSHSGNFVACAIDESPIGIDIEVIRPVRQELCKKVCAQDECAYVFPNGEFSSERFLLLWTAKEALMKQIGIGISPDLCGTCVVKNDRLFYSPPLQGYFVTEKEYVLSIAFIESTKTR